MLLVHLVMSCVVLGASTAEVAVETACCSAQQHSHSHLPKLAGICFAGPEVRPVQPSVGLPGAGQHPVAVPALSALHADGQQAAAGSSGESSAQRGGAVMEGAGTETLSLSR